MKRKFSMLVVMVMFVVSCVMPSMAMAQPENQQVDEEFVNVDVTKTTGESISLDDVAIQNGNTKQGQTRSQGVLTDEVFPGTSTLTSGDPEHVWIIEANSDRYLLMRMISANSNYKLKLCVVDWNAGVITPLQAEYSVNQTAYLQLPKGSYAFYLYSKGTVGQSYDFTYNISAKVANNVPVFITNDLLMIIQNAGYSGVYKNGQQNTLNFPDNSPELVFSRSWSYNFPAGGYKRRRVDVMDVKLHNANPFKGQIYSYSSNSANSGAVVFLKIDEDTLFSNWYTVSPNGGPVQTTKLDYRDLETPRKTDIDDILMGDNYLIYDLLSGKVIDLYGNLNSFYTTGQDARPVMKKIS